MPILALLKHDRRSRVERIETDDGRAMVRKCFTYHPAKQRLVYWIGRHPAQRERRAARWLDRQGVPVVRVESVGPIHGRSTRPRFEVAVLTAYHGPSLQHALRDSPPHDHPRLIAAVAPLVRQLLNRRVFFKDLKASNIVLGPDAPRTLDPRLIDVGSARRGLSTRQRDRMLAMLRQTCKAAGAEPAGLDRLFSA